MLKTLTRYGLLVLAATAIAAAGSVVAAVSSALASPQPSQPSQPVHEAPEAHYEAPLDGPLTVTRPFEPPSDRYAAGHRGVDLAGVPGQAVRSAGPGTVIFAGYVGGRPVISVR